MFWRDTSIARGPRRASLPYWSVITLALLSLSVLAAAEVSPQDPLSHLELTKLAAGQLVTRPTREVRGDMRLLGGASFQVISRPADEVWRALLDTQRYQKMIPTVSKAQTVVSQPDYRVVRFEHRAGPIGMQYDLNLRLDAESHDVTFALDPKIKRGPRAAWGFISLRPYTAGRTLLSYGVMADPGDGLLTSMLRGLVHEWMLRVPEQMKRFMESQAARTLYIAP
jgi:hypothetical protein